MRLFAGIPVAGAAEIELTGVLARLRDSGWPVKWVRSEGLHVTVKFLGETEDGRVPALGESLAQAAKGTGTLHFNSTGLGAFPSLGRPRILWAGFEAEAALELMVDRVERRCADLGFSPDGHPHRPHVTLGRVRDGGRLPADASAQLEREHLEGNFTADRLVLYRSHPGAGGSRFEALLTFSLGS